MAPTKGSIMPMKNTGRAPVTKAQKKEIEQKDSAFKSEVKGTVAKAADRESYSDDPRKQGK